MNDKRGLYNKYTVARNDGQSEPNRKHYGCRYFVIDIDHDNNAELPLRMYARACRATNPDLARDLRKLADEIQRRVANDKSDA